jgi:DNA-binding NarL/FixJ family response regulator
MIAEGYSTKEIAAALRIGESTVKSHQKNLMERLNIHNRVGLTRQAIRMGLSLNKSKPSI